MTPHCFHSPIVSFIFVGILCESGCDKWYHRQCAGMSKNAYDLLTREDSAEWACDTCIKKNNIPMTKMVPVT